MPAHAATRSVYFPPGDWQDFWTGALQHGPAKIQAQVPLERIPLWVKAGTVLPLAEPTLDTEDPESYKLDVIVYGDGHLPTTLYEEDAAIPPTLTAVTLTWGNSKKTGSISHARRYEAVSWKPPSGAD